MNKDVYIHNVRNPQNKDALRNTAIIGLNDKHKLFSYVLFVYRVLEATVAYATLICTFYYYYCYYYYSHKIIHVKLFTT